jgi:hypothetical protein
MKDSDVVAKAIICNFAQKAALSSSCAATEGK